MLETPYIVKIYAMIENSISTEDIAFDYSEFTELLRLDRYASAKNWDEDARKIYRKNLKSIAELKALHNKAKLSISKFKK